MGFTCNAVKQLNHIETLHHLHTPHYIDEDTSVFLASLH